MKLKETVRRVWRDLEALAYALDYDPYAGLIPRFERLERDGQSRQAELKTLSEQVLNLSEQIRRESHPTP